MKWGKVGLITLTFLVLGFLYPVNAQDFSVSLNTATNSVCPSNHVGYEIEITSQNSNQFSVDVEGIDSSWVQITPSDLSLEAGETETVWVYVQPFYTTEEGIRNFEIIISDGNDERTLSAQVDVLNCRDASLNAEPVNICGGSNTDLALNIRNDGAFTDNFRVSTSQPWAELDSTYELDSGESTTAVIPVNNPPIGEHTITVTLRSTVSYTESSLEIPVTVENCYDVSVSLQPDRVQVCPGRTQTFDLVINNEGTRGDNFDVSSDEEFLLLSDNTIGLESGETGSIRVFTNAELNETLDKDFVVNVDGQSSASASGTVDILNYDSCYSLSLSPEEEGVNVNASQNRVLTVDVTNEGMFEEEVTVSADLRDWMETSPVTVTAQPNETKRVYLYIAPPFETETGTYDISVSASTNRAETSDDIKVEVVGLEPASEGDFNATPVDNTTNQTDEKPAQNETDNMTKENETTNDEAPTGEVSTTQDRLDDIIGFLFSPIASFFGSE